MNLEQEQPRKKEKIIDAPQIIPECKGMTGEAKKVIDLFREARKVSDDERSIALRRFTSRLFELVKVKSPDYISRLTDDHLLGVILHEDPLADRPGIHLPLGADTQGLRIIFRNDLDLFDCGTEDNGYYKSLDGKPRWMVYPRDSEPGIGCEEHMNFVRHFGDNIVDLCPDEKVIKLQ